VRHGIIYPVGPNADQERYPDHGGGRSTLRAMRAGLAITIVAAMALLVPAAASAQGGSLPSNGSALDQYVESIPDGQGGRPTNDVTGGGGGGGASSGPAIGGGLQARGADGAAAARLAAATAPGVGSGGSSGGNGGGDDAGGTSSSDSDGTAVAGGSDSGSGGSGSTPSGGAGAALDIVGSSGDDTASDAIGSLVNGESDSAGMGSVLPAILLAILLVALGSVAVRFWRSRRGEKAP
jgi:hypothetical protein